MAVPLLPFAAGVGIGALVTYLVKDERIQQKVVEGARRASGIGHEGLEYLSSTGWPGQASSQAAGSQRGRAGTFASGGEGGDAACCGDDAHPDGTPNPGRDGDQIRTW